MVFPQTFKKKIKNFTALICKKEIQRYNIDKKGDKIWKD